LVGYLSIIVYIFFSLFYLLSLPVFFNYIIKLTILMEQNQVKNINIVSTTRKLINTNGNTERIFSSVNFRGILPTEIFPRYIPTELPWKKNLKQSKKKRWRVIFTDGIPDGHTDGIFRRKIPSVNCEHCSSWQLQRESPTEFSVGIFQRVLFGCFLKKFN